MPHPAVGVRNVARATRPALRRGGARRGVLPAAAAGTGAAAGLDAGGVVEGEQGAALSLFIAGSFDVDAATVTFAGLPAGARLSAHRPSLSRLLVVNAFVVLALWTATWHYIINSRPATVTSVVIGLVAGIVWGAEHVATFRQSAQWADQLSDNIDQLEQAHEELRALLDDLPEAVVVLIGA
mgnify:CR=1 FL=1